MNKTYYCTLFLFLIFSNNLVAMGPEPSDTATFLAERFEMPKLNLASAIGDQPTANNDSKTDEPEDPSDEEQADLEYAKPVCAKRKPHYVGRNLGEAVSSAASDILNLHKNLFTWNSFKVICSVFPLFVGARMLDEKLQRCFYDAQVHKNKNQMPSWCHDLAKVSIAVPIVLLGSNALFAQNDEKRWSGQILLLGMPFVIWTKKLVKQMKFDACLRPWHERYSCDKRSFGGFPSGHMAQVLYMAVLYGTRYGPRYAVPLGGLGVFIGVTFLTCNRHYLSQLIAGGAFGTLYGLAASKLVDKKLTDRVKLDIAVDEVGHPTFSASVRW